MGADKWWVIYNTWCHPEETSMIPTLRAIFSPLQRMVDKIGERIASRRTPPIQQTLAIKQDFLECATTVLAQLSLPNLYEVRHSRSNSEIGSNDTDRFHGGWRLNDESPRAHPSTRKKSEANLSHPANYLGMKWHGEMKEANARLVISRPSL